MARKNAQQNENMKMKVNFNCEVKVYFLFVRDDVLKSM